MNTKTNIGARFLKLIEKCFPPGHPLRKICNRNTIKLSYRCTPNMSAAISARSANFWQTPPAPNLKTCSCTKGKECPLEKKCLSKNIIYKANITQENGITETYTGQQAPHSRQGWEPIKPPLKTQMLKSPVKPHQKAL